MPTYQTLGRKRNGPTHVGDVTIIISDLSAEQTREILSAVTSARNCFSQAREFVTSLMRRLVIRKLRNIRASESQAGNVDGLLKGI